MNIGSVGNLESIKERKHSGKVERKKIWRKIKNRFKFNELIIYVYSNSFCLFLYII